MNQNQQAAAVPADLGSHGCNKFMQKALIFDVYGRPMMFMLPNTQQRYKTIVGSLCTILTIGIVFVYAVYKLELLINRE